MSLPKIVTFGSLALFGIIASMAFMKKPKDSSKDSNKEIVYTAKSQSFQELKIQPKKDEEKAKSVEKEIVLSASTEREVKPEITQMTKPADNNLPADDKIDLLFVTDSSKLPLVETITYSSRVPWLTGRPAWIADYASHYETSRHFIARSLNKKTDYFTQKVSPGERFNVLKKDVSFYIVIDISRAKAWFYGIDQTSNKRYLLKTYKVGLGRKDSKRISGLLTPVGKYLLGSKVAIYKPGIMGYFQDQQIEMMRVFGTRWMPFEKEIGDCSEGAKGYGLHGAPWSNDPETGKLIEDREKVGKYESDGCIRLFSEDIEELFAIIISKPTTIDLVKDFFDAKLPGIE